MTTDSTGYLPARPVHGTAAGRSATLREGRKEASSWQNAPYRSYGLGRELWKSDGTAGGTKLVKDINVGIAGSNPLGLTPF